MTPVLHNWKVAVENYNECYHCPGVHQTFSSDVVDPNNYKIAPGSIQIYPSGVVNTYHWFPLDVENTVMHRSWFFDEPEATTEQWEIIELDRTPTFAEDLSIIDSVQRGLKSRGYRPSPLVLDPSGVATTLSENTAFELKKLVLGSLA